MVRFWCCCCQQQLGVQEICFLAVWASADSKTCWCLGEALIIAVGQKQFMLEGRHWCLPPFGNWAQSLALVSRHTLSAPFMIGGCRHSPGHTRKHGKPPVRTILPSSGEACVWPHTALFDTAWPLACLLEPDILPLLLRQVAPICGHEPTEKPAGEHGTTGTATPWKMSIQKNFWEPISCHVQGMLLKPQHLKKKRSFSPGYTQMVVPRKSLEVTSVRIHPGRRSLGCQSLVSKSCAHSPEPGYRERFGLG